MGTEAKEMASHIDPKRILNLNVGVLGHVDSGKTSLVKALSTTLSTAALDKHPESRKRGITLDLGFSAFQIDVPASRKYHKRHKPRGARGNIDWYLTLHLDAEPYLLYFSHPIGQGGDVRVR